MNDAVRIPVLLLLVAIGVTVAGASVALGVGDIIADQSPAGEISIAGSNVTATGTEGETVLIANVSKTSDIEFTEDGGTISVTERANTPLTQREQRRAIEIARENSTVASYLETVENEELTVRPVKRIEREEMQTDTVEFDTVETNDSIVSGEFGQAINVTVHESDYTVTVDRDPSYVEDRAVVRVGHTGRSDARYWVKVDLESRAVTDITDWGDV